MAVRRERLLVSSTHDLFISYTRPREGFVSDLRRRIEDAGVTVWVDVTGIGPAEPWRAAVREAIIAAHTFVVVLDGEWLRSEVCQEELELAIAHGKTLVPLPVDHDAASWKAVGYRVPDELAARNYVWSAGKTIDEVAGEVVTAARTDYDWKHLSRRLQQRAVAWRESEEKIGLLRGRELVRFREAIDAAAERDPPLTDLQRAFLAASQQAEAFALELERRAAAHAESRALAGEARLELTEDPALAPALAGRAWETAPTLEAMQAMGAWFTKHPRLVLLLPRMSFRVEALAFDGSGYLAVGEELRAMVIGAREPIRRLRVWDVDQGRDEGGLSDVRGGFPSATWYDRKLLALSQAGTVCGYRVDTFERKLRQSLAAYELSKVEQLEANPLGTLLAIALGYDGLAIRQVGATVSDSAGETVVKRDFGPPQRIEGLSDCSRLAWLDDHHLLVVHRGGLIQVDLSGKDTPHTLIEPQAGIVDVDSDHGRWVALRSAGTPSLVSLDPTGELRATELIEPTLPTRIRLLPGQDLALVGGGGGHSGEVGCVIVDSRTGSVLQTLLGGHVTATTSLAVEPGAKRFAAGRSDGSAFVWSTAKTSLSEDVPQVLERTHRPAAVARVQQDGLSYQLVLEDPAESMRETFELDPIEEAGFYVASVLSIPFDIHGDTIGVGWGGQVLWFDRNRGTSAPPGRGHTNPIRCLTASPSNGLWASLATAFHDNALVEVFIWDPRSSRPLLTLRLPIAVDAVIFDSRGKTLLLLDGTDAIVHALQVDPDSWQQRARCMTRGAVGQRWERGTGESGSAH